MDGEIKNRVLQQVRDLWVLPEIEKRKKKGDIGDNFVLNKAQIVFSHDWDFPKIRLNEEVKAIVKSKVNRDVKAGETIYERDIDNIEDIQLTDQDPNCAHITLLLFKGNWNVSFDFRYNKDNAKEHLEAAKEFLDSVKDDFKNNRLRPLFEGSFACAELLTMALSMRFSKISTLGNHDARLDGIKKWAELGNVKNDFSKKLHKLSKLRYSARYLHTEEYKKENPKEYLDVLDEMYDFVDKSTNT